MPTIEYSGSPYAYGDMRTPGNPQSGPTWYDDRFDDSSGSTEVVASVSVTNSGELPGRAIMVILNMDRGEDGEEVAEGSARTISENRSVSVGVTYRVQNNRKMNLAAMVLDADSRIMIPGGHRAFTVNSYEEPPKEAKLEQNGISIIVR